MGSLRCRVRSLAAGLLLGAALVRPVGAQSYDPPLDLGTLGGSSSIAYGINDSGQVVGISSYGASVEHAFLWDSVGGMQDLGRLLGEAYSFAYGISPSGQVVGYSGNAAFLWDSAGGMQDLGTLEGSFSVAFGVNSSGCVVGASYTYVGQEHAFVWDMANGMQDLGHLGGGSSIAYGINDAGEVVGSSVTAAGEERAFVWDRVNGMRDLGTLPGGLGSYARGINNAGQIVGAALAVSGEHACLWNSNVQLVGIDIKPGSPVNPINLGSQGSVPVAILSSSTFDAAQVDPLSVTLANGGVRIKGNGTAQASLEDVNGDGLRDLVVHVATEALELSAGDVQATLSGQTVSGRRIRGVDLVRIVPS